MRRIALGLAAAAVVVLLLLQAARRERARRDRDTPDAAAAPTIDAPSTEPAATAPAPDGDVDSPPPDSRAVVRGMVTGRDGPMWGVRVIATASGDPETTLAQTWTDPSGWYRLELDAPSRVDVVALPEASTMHPGAGRRGLNLGGGEVVCVDLDLVPGARVPGRVVDTLGQPLRGLQLYALPYPDAAGIEDWAHPAALRKLGPLAARSDEEGRFVLAGVRAGGCRLFVGDEGRTLDEPVRVDPRTKDLVVEAVPAMGGAWKVLDVETQEPIDRFVLEVFAKEGDTPVLRIPGSEGALAARLPDNRLSCRMRIAADAFLPSQWLGVRSGADEATVWMRRRRPPNAALRVRYADGSAYDRSVDVMFRGAGGVTGRVTFDAVGDGVFTAALPYGSWTVVAWPLDPFGGLQRTWHVRLGPGDSLEETIQAFRGGTLVLHSASSERSTVLVFLRRAGQRGTKWAAMGEAEVRDVPPGSWEVGTPTQDGFRPFATVEVAAGGTHEVTLPPDPPR